jgi:hypothetical protein
MRFARQAAGAQPLIARETGPPEATGRLFLPPITRVSQVKKAAASPFGQSYISRIAGHGRQECVPKLRGANRP